MQLFSLCIWPLSSLLLVVCICSTVPLLTHPQLPVFCSHKTPTTDRESATLHHADKNSLVYATANNSTGVASLPLPVYQYMEVTVKHSVQACRRAIRNKHLYL